MNIPPINLPGEVYRVICYNPDASGEDTLVSLFYDKERANNFAKKLCQPTDKIDNIAYIVSPFPIIRGN